jgi:hypothetical protein
MDFSPRGIVWTSFAADVVLSDVDLAVSEPARHVQSGCFSRYRVVGPLPVLGKKKNLPPAYRNVTIWRILTPLECERGGPAQPPQDLGSLAGGSTGR